MKQFIEAKYNLHVESIIKLTVKAYKIYCVEGIYILKYHDNPSEAIMFSRLNMLNLDLFLIPIQSKYDNYIENYENLYFSITPFIQDEAQLHQDIRLHFYVKALAYLHHSSSYEVKVSDGFFDESLNYLEQQIQTVKKELQSRMERVERSDYHTPSDWYFLMNYDHFMKSLLEAGRRVDNLEDEWKRLGAIRLSLTYQNFAYEHVIVKHQKIISLDKMAIAPSIYDLKSLFEVAYSSRIDIASLMKEYFAIHPLENYEKEWLLAFLFIPKIERKANDIEDIESIFQSLAYLHTVEEFATSLMKKNKEAPKETKEN